jgi:NADPH-ferrihemoprotein reductase
MADTLLLRGSIADTSLHLLKSAAPTSFLDLAAISLVVFATSALLLREYTWDKPDPYRHKWFERPQEKLGANQNAAKDTRNIAQRLHELVYLITNVSCVHSRSPPNREWT